MKKALLLAFVSMFALQANASTSELIDAVKNNNVSKVLELLNNQENPNGLNEQGNTALHYAVAMDNADMTQILLSYGADLNAQNTKGWTPLKIAEKKDLKKVTPVLVQYLQLQKPADINVNEPAEVVAEVKEVVKQIPQQASAEIAKVPEVAITEVKEVIAQVPSKPTAAETPQAPVAMVAEIKEVVEQLPQQASVEKAQDPKVVVAEVKEAEVIKEVPTDVQTANIPAQQSEEVKSDAEVPTITESQYREVLNKAGAEIAKANHAKEEAEQKIIALQNELMKTTAQKENLAKSLEFIIKDNAKRDAEAEAKAKAEAEAKAKAEAEAKAKTEAEAKAKTEVKDEVKKAVKPDTPKKEPAKVASKKPAPKPVKPVLKKKPVYRTPQPIAKKVVITPSKIVDGIYTGDEEIVYCLDYLGNGENESMKRAAGYFAASVSISEARYKQIVDKANDFFMKASAEDMTKRDGECSKIVTPEDKSKQNQIVRSMNKSVGY